MANPDESEPELTLPEQPGWRCTLATAVEGPLIGRLLDDARNRIAALGLTMWDQPFAPEWIITRIGAGEFFVAWQGERPVATVRVLWTDPRFWGPDDGRAIYLHTLAVPRAAAGQGNGARVIAWAADEARARGRDLIRLDCAADNPGLRAYYLRAGFIPRGEVMVGQFPMLLLEKPVVRPPAAT